MPTKLLPTDFIILLLLLISLFVSSILPGASLILQVVSIFQLLLFLIFFSLRFDKTLLIVKLPEFSLLNISLTVVLLFFIASTLKNLENNNSPLSIFKSISYFVLFITLFFYFSKKLFLDNNFFEKFLKLLIGVGIFTSAFSLVIYFAGISLHPNPNFSFMATGYFMHPNTASHFYTIIIPIVIYQYFTKKIDITKFLPIIILFALGLLFTFSRAGYIGASVSILVMAYSKSKKYFFLTAILLIISIYLFILDFAFTKGDSSLSRILLWAAAVDMIVRDAGHGLWGYGVSNALTIFQSEKIYFGSIEEVPDPHNVVLLLSIQFGLIFVASLFIFLIILFAKIYFKRNTDYFILNRSKIFLSLSIILGLTSQNMLENVLAYPEHFALNVFFIFIGFLYHFINVHEKNNLERIA